MTEIEKAREAAVAAVMSGSVVLGSSGMSRKKAEAIVDALAKHHAAMVLEMVARAEAVSP